MATLKLVIDGTLDGDVRFLNAKEVNVQKEDIFSYGVFQYEPPPDKIRESAYEHLQSMIPAYYGMYHEQIDFFEDARAIVCTVHDEAARRVNEVVGIGIGLKAASELLKFDRRHITRIPPSPDRGKRLDFDVKRDGESFQIETKGTLY